MIAMQEMVLEKCIVQNRSRCCQSSYSLAEGWMQICSLESESMLLTFICKGSLSGLELRQLLQDLPEWHLVEHGFPAFLQEH